MKNHFKEILGKRYFPWLFLGYPDMAVADYPSTSFIDLSRKLERIQHPNESFSAMFFRFPSMSF